jgi:hypothetical protein
MIYSYEDISKLTASAAQSQPSLFDLTELKKIKIVLSADPFLKSLLLYYPPKHFIEIFFNSIEFFEEDLQDSFPASFKKEYWESCFYSTRFAEVNYVKEWLINLHSSQKENLFYHERIKSNFYCNQVLSLCRSLRQNEYNQLAEYVNSLFKNYSSGYFSQAKIIIFMMRWCLLDDPFSPYTAEEKKIHFCETLKSSMRQEKNPSHSVKDLLQKLEYHFLNKTLMLLSKENLPPEYRYAHYARYRFFNQDSDQPLPSALFYSLYLKARTESYCVKDAVIDVVGENSAVDSIKRDLFKDEGLNQISEIQRKFFQLRKSTQFGNQLLYKIKSYLVTDHYGNIVFPMKLKSHQALFDMLYLEFERKLHLVVGQPYPLMEKNQYFDFFMSHQVFFVPRKKIIKQLIIEEDHGPLSDLMIKRMAELSQLSLEHLYQLISVLPKDSFDHLFNQQDINILSWEDVFSNFLYLKNQLLKISKQLVCLMPKQYVHYLYCDDELLHLLAETIDGYKSDDMMVLAPDWILAQTVVFMKNFENRAILFRQCCEYKFEITAKKIDQLCTLNQNVQRSQQLIFSRTNDILENDSTTLHFTT